MPRAKKAVKETKKAEVVKEEVKEKYFYGKGRRKTSTAKVRLFAGIGKFIVNNLPAKEYFPSMESQKIINDPLIATGNANKFDISVKVIGGGKNSQAGATRHGIARALLVFDENLKKQLRDLGFLTRDTRMKERKKPGLKRARKAPQWQKR